MRILSAAGLLLIACFSASAEEVERAIYDFTGDKPAKGWHLNIWGKNAQGEKGAGRIEVVEGRQGGKALRLITENVGPHNFVSAKVPDGPWRNAKYTAVVLWYKGNGSKDKANLRVFTSEKGQKKRHGYAVNLFLGKREWQRVVLKSFWRRAGTPPLDLSRLYHLQISGPTSYEVTVGYVGLISAGREIYLEEKDLPQVVAPQLSAAPNIDGRLDDPAWKEAVRVEGLRVFGNEVAPARYPTTAMLGYRGGTLYLAVRMRGEDPKKIPADWRVFDTTVWKDSCLEFYLDPGDTNETGYQFCVNSIGTRLDICTSRAWNGKWEAKARLDDKDGWMVEIACDLTSVGAEPKPGDLWGFNLKRHVVSGGKFVEISGWSQGRPAPVSKYGLLVFGPASPLRMEVGKPELGELKEGSYVCRAVLTAAGKAPVDARLSVSFSGPRGTEKKTADVVVKAPPGKDSVSNIAIPYPVERDGEYCLAMTVRDSEGLLVGFSEYAFQLSRIIPFRYSDIVLWPPAQIWKPAKAFWTLPAKPTLLMRGKGDAFPAEHLAERLEAMFGTRINRSRARTADLLLTYVGKGVKPEGYELDVTAKGVQLRAGDGRGMYYGVRTLLNLMQQSSLGAPEPRAQCVECRDWPGVPNRVVYHRMDDRYRVTKGVRTYQDFIYDQVAGGRYNLLILNLRGGIRYDSHPETHYGSAMTKAEIKEILDFARRHYVDVAPGGNSPGHADWLTRKHPQLREDGDRSTLCTSHPDTLPLMYDLYGELIDLFQPTKYFHLGGDEVRWRTAATSAEKHCKLCKGKEKRDLLLEHWTALAEFCHQRGVRPILWGDMLSEQWNGGGIYQTARIISRLPKYIITASWSTRALANPGSYYRKHGFTPWKILTSFGPGREEKLLEYMKDQKGLGIAEFMSWPWSNFLHFSYQTCTRYSTPAVHVCAACAWKPEVSSMGWHRMVGTQGRHWMKTMQITPWGARKVTCKPVSIAGACNETTRDEKAGDGKGWLDLGPERDLGTLPRQGIKVGVVPFDRPAEGPDCVVLRESGLSKPVELGRKARGLVFLHTSAASAEDVAKLYKRFFRQNRRHYGMPIAFYRVRYANGEIVSVPVKLGWHVHLWDCIPAARVMPGARSYWLGFTRRQQQRDPNAADVCAWTMEWKNPHPQEPIVDVQFVAAGTEATVIWLGLSCVE